MSVPTFSTCTFIAKFSVFSKNAGELTTRRKRAAANVLWPLAHRIGYTHPRRRATLQNGSTS